ncbi:hypothetical protein BJ508DRAFT_323786 [Ascobolus immersus RN42]|uniref:Uncharacterized protein n=1 Tax=Ascobolus immersus RN42 TaxID=1160509 RepID=A0A3N4IJ00_ASCIM|nr:hypothetical protein BJ508DRAFT_323786 [Ascobolus immersus RN42]
MREPTETESRANQFLSPEWELSRWETKPKPFNVPSANKPVPKTSKQSVPPTSAPDQANNHQHINIQQTPKVYKISARLQGSQTQINRRLVDLEESWLAEINSTIADIEQPAMDPSAVFEAEMLAAERKYAENPTSAGLAIFVQEMDAAIRKTMYPGSENGGKSKDVKMQHSKRKYAEEVGKKPKNEHINTKSKKVKSSGSIAHDGEDAKSTSTKKATLSKVEGLENVSYAEKVIYRGDSYLRDLHGRLGVNKERVMIDRRGLEILLEYVGVLKEGYQG